MNNIFTFSIIIPARNEQNNLKILLPELCKVLRTNNSISKFELIVINHNSTDNSKEVLYELKNQSDEIKVIEINDEKIGLGDAVKIGFRQAQYEFIITMDGDQSHPPIFIENFVNACSEGYKVIIGSRYMKKQTPFEPKGRYRISKLFNFISKLFINKNISDYTTGFRCFEHNLLNEIELKSKNFSYHLEINIKLIKKSSKIKEIPIRYEKRLEGKSKLVYRKEFWGYFRILIKEIF